MCGRLDLEIRISMLEKAKQSKEKIKFPSDRPKKYQSSVAWFSKILKTVCKGASYVLQMTNKMNCWNAVRYYVYICFVWVACVELHRPHAHFFTIKKTKTHCIVCQRINHALIGYSVPVTHRWLQVNWHTFLFNRWYNVVSMYSRENEVQGSCRRQWILIKTDS